MGPSGTAHFPEFEIPTRYGVSNTRTNLSGNYTREDYERARSVANELQRNAPTNYIGPLYDPDDDGGWTLPVVSYHAAGASDSDIALMAANLHAASLVLGLDDESNVDDPIDGIGNETAWIGTTHHRAVGGMKQLVCRVTDDYGKITDAWVGASRIITALHDYPILDEDLFYEFEYQAWNEAVDWAIEDLGLDPEDVDREAVFDYEGSNPDYAYTAVREWARDEGLRRHRDRLLKRAAALTRRIE